MADPSKSIDEFLGDVAADLVRATGRAVKQAGRAEGEPHRDCFLSVAGPSLGRDPWLCAPASRRVCLFVEAARGERARS